MQIVRGAALRGRDGHWDIAIEGETIAAVDRRLEASAEAEIEAEGRLLTPAFVNAHVHLDKCMLGDVMRPNESQTLQEAIEITWDHKRGYTHRGDRGPCRPGRRAGNRKRDDRGAGVR